MNRLQPLLKELAKHHEFASQAQVAVLRRTEAARQKLAERAGHAFEPAKIEPTPFDPAAVDGWGLAKLRENDVLEIAEFVKHQRQYTGLLLRYQGPPEDGLDRVHATARRVGLDASKL